MASATGQRAAVLQRPATRRRSTGPWQLAGRPAPHGPEQWSRWMQFFRVLAAALLAAATGWFIVFSWHWPLANDAALMHYAVFMQQHGFAAYRGVHDINLPGAYLPSWLAISLSTPSTDNLTWRLYDLGLLALAGVSMIFLARSTDWFAGIFAAALFALFHGRDGIGQTGQRDLAIAALLLLATTCLVTAVRRVSTRRLPGPDADGWLFAGFGLALGAATTTKPFGVVYFAVLLGWALLAMRRQGRSVSPALFPALLGFGVPLAGAMLFLLHNHAARSFLDVCRVTLPFHASVGRFPLWAIIGRIAPLSLLKLAGVALVLFVVRRSWRRPEIVPVLLCMGLGICFFLLQDKGYSYQRYPHLAFLLLWVALECTSALKDQRWPMRLVGLAGLLFGIFGLAPSYLRTAHHAQWHEPYLQAMQQDLRRAGGTALDRRVQCIDSISGCANVLYRMRLVQATGTLYDEFLFPPPDRRSTPPQAVAAAQQTFLGEILRNPPQVFVVASWLFPEGPGDYQKLALWPVFRTYLADHYVLADEQNFPRAENGPLGFRMYVRKPEPALR
ncbi:MAG TPA: hypothetical protein VGD62_08165 [Acidobacteriaceae bacterium]